MVGSRSTTEAAGRALITELRSLLGARLVAYLANTNNTRTVRDWADGTSALPNQAILDRLQVALEEAQLLSERDSPAVAQTWFQGRNPALDDRPPALLLREEHLDQARALVLDAVQVFKAHGT